MHPMNSFGHMAASRVLDEGHMASDMQRFFLTRQRDEILMLHHKSNGNDLATSMKRRITSCIPSESLIEDEEAN